MSRRSSRGIVQKRAFSPDPEPSRRSTSSDGQEKKRKFRPLSPSNILPPRLPLIGKIEPRKDVQDDFVRVSHESNNQEEVDVTSYDAASPSDSAISSNGGGVEHISPLDLPDIVNIPDEIKYLTEHMDIYSKVMDIGSFDEGNNIVQFHLPAADKSKMEISDKRSILYTKVHEVAKEVITTVQQFPVHYSPIRSSAMQLYEATKLMVEYLGQNNIKHFELLKIIHQQETMMEFDSKRKNSDAIIYNFTFANALQFIDTINLDIDLAKCHLWFMHRLNENSLAAYLMLIKYVLSIDERLAIYFQLHYPPFNIAAQFNIQQLVDPYSELVTNIKENQVLASAKTNVIICFDKGSDDKMKHVGLFSRGFNNLGCKIFHLASLDDNVIEAFVEGCKTQSNGTISPVFFIVKVIFESIAISMKVGSICFIPKIECYGYKDVTSEACKKVVLCCRNSNDRFPTYVDFGFNGLTPAFFVKMYMERIQYFMENILSKVSLTSL